MANIMEMAVDKIREFREIQDYMQLAKEEGAEKTYALLKKKYTELKVCLQVFGVNLTELDALKE